MSSSIKAKRKRISGASVKPPKPYPDFPLSPHARGQWVKKINGKTHYFGRWGQIIDGKMVRVSSDGWKEALELYKAQANDLHAGRSAQPKTDERTVNDLCNHFLTAKYRQRESGEITHRTYDEYKSVTDRLISLFGGKNKLVNLSVQNFDKLRSVLAGQYGPVRLGNEIQRVRTVFKYGYEAGLIERPMRFGPNFKKPSAAVLRKHRAKTGPKLFEADEIRLMFDGKTVVDDEGNASKIAGASPQLKAMILLGVQAGFGNTDCGTLPESAVDLDGGWIDYPRPKTGVERRCPLWPETIEAIHESCKDRPAPKLEARGLVFVTRFGGQWADGTGGSPVSKEFKKLLKSLDLYRPKFGFYTLRHTFRTIADGCKDQVAINYIMGHADSSIANVYRERIENERLIAVTDHVHDWLFTEEKEGGTA